MSEEKPSARVIERRAGRGPQAFACAPSASSAYPHRRALRHPHAEPTHARQEPADRRAELLAGLGSLAAPSLVPDEDTLKRIRRLANIQCTQEDGAGALLVSERTFFLFLRVHMKALEALKLGRLYRT